MPPFMEPGGRTDMLRDNPVMKKLVETGEERIGKLTQQLLSNEKFIGTVQTLVSRSLAANIGTHRTSHPRLSYVRKRTTPLSGTDFHIP